MSMRFPLPVSTKERDGFHPSSLIMSPQTYTYIARDNEKRKSHLDLHAMANLEDPTEHARKLLRDHQSCDRVEIWQDETFIVAVSRADQP
jgi:hypothetical protein